MAPATASDRSYEEFFREHAGRFEQVLARTLGAAREGAGGRIGVADTLQEAMAEIYRRWPDLEVLDGHERDRRLYRCLRDAAGAALRREHGRLGAKSTRPRVVAYDFGSLQVGDGAEAPRAERELTSAVLGSLTRDLVDEADHAARRAVLDKAILLAGLRALSEREAVVLIAVDHLEWEPGELADHLGLAFGSLRATLFEARRVFYGVVRHAAGVELDELERATLHAYRAGELSGRERRLARRHLQSCEACQRFSRELERFSGAAHHVLAPLPFVLTGGVMAKKMAAKPVAATATVKSGLLSHPGAAKALAATTATLAVGFGAAAYLSEGTPVTTKPKPVTAPVQLASSPLPTGVLSASRTYTRAITAAHQRQEQRLRAASKAAARRAAASREKASKRANAAGSATSQQTTAAASVTPPSSQAPSTSISPQTAATPSTPTGGATAGGSSSATGSTKGGGSGEFFGQ